LRILKEFLDGFDFLRMKPADGVVVGGLPAEGRTRVLAENGRQYAIYLFGAGAEEITLDLPAGKYGATWISVMDGQTLASPEIDHSGGHVALAVPKYDPDIALRIVRANR
jgi:hypothetical protein